METSRLVELGVLGFLAEESADIRTVRERFKHNFGRYLTVSYGALGPAFERLEAADHVSMVSITDERRRTEYEITERGRDRLRALLREPIPDEIGPARQPHLVVKVGFLHHLPEEERTDKLAALVDQFERARNRWMDVKATHTDAVSDSPGYRRDLQELNVRLYDTYLEWLDELEGSDRDR